ncbi:MAG: hypothetical protein HRT67_02805 [Flavobacteriaceae bacterium]|nr:hypothetical protein [Flavobacteriaceae bacterium]
MKKINKTQVHKKQPSEKNHQRLISQFTDSGIFVWYSSNTKVNNYGSLMVHIVNNSNIKTFYIGFKKNKEWNVINSIGVNKKELGFFKKK